MTGKSKNPSGAMLPLVILGLAVPVLVMAGPPHGGHGTPMMSTTSAMQHVQHKSKIKAQTSCPITGKKLASRDVYLDYEGQRVYFCCAMCKKKFLENPQAVFDKFAGEGVVPDNVQKTCPVCDSPVDKNSKWFMYKGRRIYYGCPGCDKKFLEDPEKYLKKLGRPSGAESHGKHGSRYGHRMH